MEVKWVCRICNSVNIGEEVPHMRCYVCDTERDKEPLLSPGLHRPGTPPEEDRDIVRPVPAGGPGTGGLFGFLTGLKDRIRDWWRSIRPASRPALALDSPAERAVGPERAPASGEIIGWNIDLSPDESGEAYVRAVPVLDTVRRPVPEPELPGGRPAELPSPDPGIWPKPHEPEDPMSWPEFHKTADPAIWPEPSAPDPVPSESEEELPWPEHRIQLAKEALLARGFVRTERALINGVKGYKLFDGSGRERFLTLNNMRMLGFAVDL